MTWPQNFDVRLRSWHDLRSQAQSQTLDQALCHVNDWWWKCPTVNHYLHWDDWRAWPDPWRLLADDIYCELARALGILYTLDMLNHAEIIDCNLTGHKEYNLVRVNKGKYTLNWSPGEIVNIQSPVGNHHHRIHSKQLSHKIG